MNRPIPTNIFHITAIENLAKIGAVGSIFSKNSLHTQLEPHQSIAHSSIQNRRAHKQVQCAPGGFIHDYVPFYFAPRSPMLFDAPHIGGYAQFFHSLPNREGYEQRLETRQAEFLVHQHVDLNLITRIGVANEAKRNEVAHILAQNGVKLMVDVRSDWYF